MKLAVFVSGQGTLLQKLIDSKKHEILYVCADRVCPALEIAVKAGLSVHAHDKTSMMPKPDLNVLAGFMSAVPMGFETNKFINVHPSLLPAFGGKDMYGDKVFSEIKQSQSNFTGCTVHFCDSEYDSGPIIFQSCIKVQPEWSKEEIAEATHKLELPTLLAAIEGIEYVAKYCQDKTHTHLDYVRAVHKVATEITQDGADMRSWAAMGRKALASKFKDDEMIEAETNRCAAIAEEMGRYDIAAVIRGEMEIGEDLISENGDC